MYLHLFCWLAFGLVHVEPNQVRACSIQQSEEMHFYLSGTTYFQKEKDEGAGVQRRSITEHTDEYFVEGI